MKCRLYLINEYDTMIKFCRFLNAAVLSAALIFVTFDNLKAQDISKDIRKLAQTMYYMNRYYLDTVNFTQISDEAVSAMMKKLDPHSAFISAKDVKAMNEPLEGNFDGIGIEFAIINDSLSVQNVIAGGPSEKVGLRTGDKIVSVDGEAISATNLDIPRVHKYLRGPKGSRVELGIFRRGVPEILDYTVVRDKIPINSIDSHYLTPDNILYIRLTRFAATSYNELIDVLRGLSRKPSGIILDLRSNVGGYLTAALMIANEFLDKGEMILYTEGLRSPRKMEYADGRGVLKDIKTAVLIDENSASASEIVSGALQDWDRATIIGRKSFGKGLVQQQLPLEDGSVIRLTVARYHTPSGRVIQAPYEMGDAAGYYKNFYERYKRGEYFSKDSIQLPDSLKYQTLRLKRTVYGGGGIMPDIFIPADTSFYTQFYGELVRKGIITDFANDYSDKHRDELVSKYKDYNTFIEKYNVTDDLFGQFLLYAEKKGAKPKEGQLEISGNEIKRFIKSLVVRNLYGFNWFIEYLNRDDREVQRALDVIRGKE